jgi:hypothetical protein
VALLVGLYCREAGEDIRANFWREVFNFAAELLQAITLILDATVQLDGITKTTVIRRFRVHPSRLGISLPGMPGAHRCVVVCALIPSILGHPTSSTRNAFLGR